MASLSKRDIEMIFRAETDAAQRPVQELSADVKRLRGEMESLAKSGDKSEKSLESLAKATRDLEQAQQELSNARTLLTQLNSQATALERTEAAADKATKKYNELKAQVDGAEAPTKRLTASLEAAERGMTANNAKLDEAKKNYAEVKTSIEGIIGPVENVQDAFRQVAVAQREVTQGLAQAKNDTAEQSRALAAGLRDGTEQVRTEEKTLALERQNEAMVETARKQKQRDEIESILMGNQRLESQINDLVAAEQRLAQVDAFRKLAVDGLAAQSAAERIGDTLNNAATPAQRLAQSVAAIVNPAQAAAGTLDGMDERLDAVINKINTGKIGVNEWGHLNNELQSVQANLIKVSAEIDRYAQQQTKVDAAAAAYDRQAAKVRELAAADAAASGNVEQLTADLAREQKVLQGLGAALDKATTDHNEMANAMRQAGIDAKALPTAIGRIEATANRAAPALKKVQDVITPGGSKGFLGLDPYQLQNLSYQVNDVFTGLASGQPIFQIFAQQAGQFAQIPGLLSKIVANIPALAALAGGIALVAGAIGEANAQIETLRTANAVLATLGDNNGYDASKFVEIAEAFRDMGVAAEEANEAAKIFVTEGLNPKAVDDYVVAARNLADVAGIEVVDAVKELTSTFTAGADEVIKLDDKYHFLTDTQRENIIASKDTKREYEEVNKAFSILYTKLQDGADLMNGPATDATNTLRNAWDGLKKAFADTGVFEAVQSWLSDAVIGFAHLINLARRVGAAFTSGFSGAVAKSGGPVGALLNPAKFAANLFTGTVSNAGSVFSDARDDTERQFNQGQQRFNRPQANPGADAGEGSSGRQVQQERKDKAARKKSAADAKKAAAEAEAARKRAAAEAERLRKQYESEQDQLQTALSRFTAEALRGTSAPLAAQLEMARTAVDEQFKSLEDRLNEFSTKFGDKALINGRTQAEYKAALNAQKQQIQLNRQLGVYESNVNDLLKERDTKLKSIKDEQDAGLLSAQQGLDKVREVTSEMGPKIDEAVVAARAFIAALTPSAETDALLAKFDRIIKQGAGAEGQETIARKTAQSGYGAEEDKLNDIFQRRAALIQAANRLYDLGVTNFTEKEAAVKAAYDQTNGAITQQIATMQAFLTANQDLFPPEVYQRAIAELQAYNTELKYTDTLTQQVKASAEDAIVNGVMNMFDSLSQGIANIITGAGSLKDLFSDLGRAALNFAADFLQSIAKAIMQIYALRIAKSLIGGFHGGGEVGNYGAGVMKLSRGIGAPDLSGVPRYHNGTQGAGLKSNEMLAVLEKGEKVSTEEQQRLDAKRLKDARSNTGRGLRQVLAIGDKEIASAMSGAAGDEVQMTWLERNRATVKQMLGIGG